MRALRFKVKILTSPLSYQLIDSSSALSARDTTHNDDADSTVLIKRGNKAQWVPYKELHKSPQEDFEVHVRGYHPKKSMSRRISSGVAKKPFFTFAVVGSGLLALNTYIVAEAIKKKEDKVMQLKIQKGELPVVIPDPPKPVKKAAGKKVDPAQQTAPSSPASSAIKEQIKEPEKEAAKKPTEEEEKGHGITPGSS